MRVSGGSGRGRRLRVPAGNRVRPTSDKVKQALFNILADRVAGAVFLDLYAGAGNIGIEALSRGAEHATFVDASKESMKTIKKNIERTGFERSATVIQSDAEAFLKKGSGRYDIIFLDPPYAVRLEPLLNQIAGSRILNSEGVVVAEHFKKQETPETVEPLTRFREARYGDTVLSFYTVFEPRMDTDEHG